MSTLSFRSCVVVLGASLISACATVTPMQTASVVDLHTFRIGGQVSTAGFCGDPAGGGVGLLRCTEYPDGIPLPELRANGRVGIARGADVGVSVLGQGQLFAPERPFTLGLTLDAKKELLRIPMVNGPTHIFSAGLLFGANTAFRSGLQAWGQVDWGVPLFYGLQFERLEVVLGATVSRREVDGPTPSPDLTLPRVTFSLGLFRRAPAGLAVQLSYVTDPARFLRGAVQLQVGVFWDVR